MKGDPAPDARQLALHLAEEEAIGRATNEALAEYAEVQAYRWRLQLVIAESVMMTGLVLLAGWILHLPGVLILRAAAMVGAASLAAGIFMLWLSTSLVRAVRQLAKGWRR